MPASFTVKRSLDIRAPADRLFPQIADFNAWPAWSPYEKRDPAMKRRFSGKPSGVGAIYEWDGNRNVGQGRMEILELTQPSKMRIDLQFMKPFKAHNVAEFTLEPRGQNTNVTWAMYGPVTFMSRVMGLFINMDKMIGKDFEAGLQNLKAIAEK
ncbi:MAG TPA: SRPBCC family protein [Reyranella sp.]|nr:SRPBCC family protein [Reyranella sp.]